MNSSKNNLSKQERKQIENERKLMEKSLKVAEKMISFPFPKSFYSDLVDKLSATNLLLFNDIGGKVIHPVKARFQADSLIVRQIFNGESTLCLANDTDYGFMGGSKVLQVSSLKLRGVSWESKSIIDIDIITTDTTTFKAMSDAHNTTEKIKIVKAKFPIFDRVIILLNPRIIMRRQQLQCYHPMKHSITISLQIIPHVN